MQYLAIRYINDALTFKSLANKVVMQLQQCDLIRFPVNVAIVKCVQFTLV